MLPSNVMSTATASVGFTTFSTATGGSQIPKVHGIPDESSHYSSSPPVLREQTAVRQSPLLKEVNAWAWVINYIQSMALTPPLFSYLHHHSMVLNGDTVSVAEPFTVEGSALLSGSVMQVSVHLMQHGNF